MAATFEQLLADPPVKHDELDELLDTLIAGRYRHEHLVQVEVFLEKGGFLPPRGFDRRPAIKDRCRVEDLRCFTSHAMVMIPHQLKMEDFCSRHLFHACVSELNDYAHGVFEHMRFERIMAYNLDVLSEKNREMLNHLCETFFIDMLEAFEFIEPDTVAAITPVEPTFLTLEEDASRLINRIILQDLLHTERYLMKLYPDWLACVTSLRNNPFREHYHRGFTRGLRNLTSLLKDVVKYSKYERVELRPRKAMRYN